MKRSRFPLIVTLLVLLFFYLPIMVLVINSFNASRFGSGWEGFSLIWYRRLFDSPEIWRAVQNSLVIAFGATLLSLLLGTTAAFALHKYARSRLQSRIASSCGNLDWCLESQRLRHVHR